MGCDLTFEVGKVADSIDFNIIEIEGKSLLNDAIHLSKDDVSNLIKILQETLKDFSS